MGKQSCDHNCTISQSKLHPCNQGVTNHPYVTTSQDHTKTQSWQGRINYMMQLNRSQQKNSYSNTTPSGATILASPSLSKAHNKPDIKNNNKKSHNSVIDTQEKLWLAEIFNWILASMTRILKSNLNGLDSRFYQFRFQFSLSNWCGFKFINDHYKKVIFLNNPYFIFQKSNPKQMYSKGSCGLA